MGFCTQYDRVDLNNYGVNLLNALRFRACFLHLFQESLIRPPAPENLRQGQKSALHLSLRLCLNGIHRWESIEGLSNPYGEPLYCFQNIIWYLKIEGPGYRPHYTITLFMGIPKKVPIIFETSLCSPKLRGWLR